MDLNDIVVALAELEALYEWLSQSPTGTDEDLHGLDTAITVLRTEIEKRS